MSRTLYLNIKGGLGNQMFQAALGLHLEYAAGLEVRHLTQGFTGDNYQRHYLLDKFVGLRGKVVPVSEAQGAAVFSEPPGVSAPEKLRDEVMTLARGGPDKLVLDGYWQNEIYFGESRDVIRAAFTLDLDEKAIALGRNLRAEGCIAMHVRRSDYGHHGLAASDFYRDAIAAIRAEAGPKPVLVFTDEYNFCRFEFGKIADLQVVRGDVQNPMMDFYLYHCCQHYILSNSSFSWWGAWLGETESSIVYAPLPWCLFDLAANPVPARWRAVAAAVKRQ